MGLANAHKSQREVMREIDGNKKSLEEEEHELSRKRE